MCAGAFRTFSLASSLQSAGRQFCPSGISAGYSITWGEGWAAGEAKICDGKPEAASARAQPEAAQPSLVDWARARLGKFGFRDGGLMPALLLTVVLN